jgi:transcriptional regulator with XRE-family HTH domain
MAETFGQRLKRIRREKKLTQLKLEKMSGISHHSISNYEKGKKSPNIVYLEWLCKALDVTASELLGY